MSSPRVSSPKRDSRSASPTAASQQSLNNTPADASLSSSDDDSEILRPRGRLAARLQARNSDQNASGSETERGGAESQTEDDEVITTRPRKLKPRRQRSASPQDTPRQQNQSVAPSPRSPGLFLTPSKPRSPAAASNAGSGSDSGDDEVPSVTKNSRFMALVAKKRREREAKEAEEARKGAERLAAQQEEDDNMSIVDDEDPDEITDDEGGRKLTQEASRPARKASKKALEEMNRETQRLTRSLQLAHEAKVKKKITKSALFERFNFYPKGAPEAAKLPSSQPTTPGSGPQTDAEMKDAETPPSSAPAHEEEKDAPQPHNPAAPAALVTLDEDENEDEDLPTLEDAIKASAARTKLDKGKGKTVDDGTATEQPPPPKPKRKFRVKLPEVQVNKVQLEDDDDDLRIEVSHKTKIDAIFDRVPVNMAKESRPMHNLRKLAQLDDPDKQPGSNLPPKHRQSKHQQPTISVAELQADLLQRARQQAKLERDRHLETLRAKGVHVQTAEEREQELAQIEDIVAKARQEAEELMQREREAAKEDRKAKKAGGELDPLAWDDSEDDEDYQEDGEEKELAEVELSGSDDEVTENDDDEGMGEDEGSEVETAGVLIDDAAESADESEGEERGDQAEDEDGDEDMPAAGTNRAHRRPRKTVAILSDDDEDEPSSIVKATPRPKAKFLESPSATKTTSPVVPTSVLRSATKTFIPGLPVAGPAGLGLTQMFAGTMDDSQAGSPGGFNSPTQPRPTFDVNEFPESNFSLTAREFQGEDMILDSQPAGGKTQDAETQGVQFNFSQSQAHGLDALLPNTQGASQMSELIEPSQDGGYHNFSPLLQRFVEAPASTAETTAVPGSQGDVDHAQSPLVRRAGRLRRRAEIVATTAASDNEAEAEGAPDPEGDEFGFGTSANAFTAMKEAADKEKKRKAAELFNKKKSKAREMVEEQAEESEDEYAGLGGVDGEDSDDSDAEDVKEMIDDETKNDESDERKLAAFYADRERASDEKQVEKLFHDITTGALRRKRGGDWDDLDDEDDGGEARRRLKRRQFAKMQKALFADERISKVAENPRNQAFLKTIEDHGSDDDMDFIFAPSPTVPTLVSEDSQSSANGDSGPATIIPDSQPQESRRAPAHLRRTKDGKKPSNIDDIRESLSNLLDEPLNSSTVIPATDHGSSDDEAEAKPPSSTTTNKENHNPRRRNRPAIVDRISLKRNSSSNLSTTSRLAFATNTSSSSTGTFKVPPLLRRATTNSLVSSSSSTTSSTGVTTNNTSTDAATAKIKKPAGKRSGVNYFARENEQRAAVAEMERRREAKKWKGAEGRSEVVGGLFGGGKFE
ncbi:mediator of replication checkpoint protein 1 [Podospora aff. communis PSN243]|uniref:Mediator of replication checkpoint protein 1 n=1 Tax=Podospora aff. communis PSN243 TaxID=3040156 RepID=A0AAV9GIA9_9PEZI|nr:mediator of replication checkpoint protein 1 [Podospora aff. communis PSN243]